jgi:flagellar biosynthesis chaperone FliJ
MANLDHLNKLRFLIEKHEQNLMEKCLVCKKKLDEELRKYYLLKNCLDDYRHKLSQQGQTLASYHYQQYQDFFTHLEKAINQQTEVVDKCKNAHSKLVNEVMLVKKKLENLTQLITKEAKAIQFKLEKKENQQATDLFNQIKQMK